MAAVDDFEHAVTARAQQLFGAVTRTVPRQHAAQWSTAPLRAFVSERPTTPPLPSTSTAPSVSKATHASALASRSAPRHTAAIVSFPVTVLAPVVFAPVTL